jgi:hypothetical protein
VLVKSKVPGVAISPSIGHPPPGVINDAFRRGIAPDPVEGEPPARS